MPLTTVQVRSATGREKGYKLADSGGLYLFVTPKGAKSWRFKYRFGGREKRLTFGLFPEVSLAEARQRRDDARALLRENKDPVTEAERRAAAASAAAGAIFEKVAREWHQDEKARWSPGQASRVLRALERDIFPVLGKLPVADITGPMILAELRKIEQRGAIETAKRVRGYVSGVFARAEAEHLVDDDPTRKIGRALRPTVKGAKQPAIVELEGLKALQTAVDLSTSNPVTKLASRLLALTSVRVGVLRSATWAEFEGIDWQNAASDTSAAVWKIPANRMKLEVAGKSDSAFDHDVPLAPQAVDVLRALKPLTGRIDLLFPSTKSTRVPMSDSAISSLYKRSGYRGRMVPHGWRSAFSTIMNERAVELDREGDRIAIDLMLAHVPQGMSASEFAYNRARYAKRRRDLALTWAEMITAGLAPPSALTGDQVRT